MSGSTDKTDQLFWLAYGQAIKEKAGINFGSTGAFFLATEAQKGPPAGDTIPDEYTYRGLFNIGNNLLADDNLFYNPSATNGYAETLSTFLDYVQLDAHPDPALDAALLLALKKQDGFQNKSSTELTKAMDRYAVESKNGLTKLNLGQWLNTVKGSAYQTAETQLSEVAQDVSTIQAKISGTQAASVQNDRALLRQGLDVTNDNPGFNMHCAFGNVLSPAEVLNNYNNSQKTPAPTFELRPAFDAPGYKAVVQNAQTKVTSDYHPDKSYTFKLSKGTKTSDYNFGQTTAGGDVGFSYTPWFSFTARAGHSEESSSLKTGEESEDVEVTITYDDISLVTISPGSWNFSVQKYKLRPDAPARAKTLVRPSQLVLATRLGYSIKLGANSASTVDNVFKSTTTGGGSLSIFGIPISVGGDFSKRTENTTHVSTWDNANRTITVAPSNDTGCATIVGIVGEKLFPPESK